MPDAHDAIRAAERAAGVLTAATQQGTERKEAVRRAVAALKSGPALRLDGMPLSTGVEVVRRLARVDGSLAQIPQSHLVFARRFPGHIPAGALIANAQVDGDPEVGITNGLLTGEKRFCTGSAYADLLAVTVSAEPAVAVLIRADAPGVGVTGDWAAMGQSYTASGTVRFDRVDVAQAPRSLRSDALALRHYGAYAQALHAGIDLGLFEGAVSAAYERAGLPRNAGGEDQLLSALVGEVEVELYVARASLSSMLGALDDPSADANEVAEDVTAAKLAIQDAALRTVQRLFEVTGTAGAAGQDPLDRWWRDLRTHTLHDKRRVKLGLLGRRVVTGERIPRNEKLGG
ncbi:acyl-CoA dehydrogenase family protein [Corynebacterium liangguodongii]|uniref:Acyl-CoA dehydrogenase n=1 Tax=Corynebacterium liangguodongii TaxID=2079535 RepID=A0A2S0WBD2_9CORY|nr:acyl-CoA dehydrogenase family protein [Corynebacterium liangguodongii]AWB83081.1 acyl-CoA dehydrogenase [Corynebacterium liangguodongii]PWB99318.1 acyl-CoA dehydrogenase [Corynebacterium liangguodongii]